MTATQHYTFGDNDAAAERLGLLARAFAPSSRAWLDSLALPRGLRAVDLGCGPGLTTALLGDRLAPAHLYGIDRSERLIARAGSAAAAGARFFVHDLTQGPLPVPPADLLYARFLLTHVSSPARVLELWAQAAAAGGRLLLEEVAALHCAHPVLRRYYQLVEQLQAHYGQSTYIGGHVDRLVRGNCWAIERTRVERIELPARVMARLHALNLQTWGSDVHAQSAFDRAELDALGVALEQIAGGAQAPPVTCQMAQLVLRNTRDPRSALAGAQLQIVDAHVEQSAALVALQRSAFAIEAERDATWSITPLLQTEQELAAEIAGGAQSVLVALLGDALVGSVRAQLQAGTCHVARLVVRPDLHGLGIGRALMAAIEARCAAAERYELFTSATSARNLRLYERLGYRAIRRGRECGGIEVVFMEKPRSAHSRNQGQLPVL